ncbi:hypothetical protein CWC38_03810 [Kocuria tytonicola]|uniref:hypothetical protein n=1 Tax=Kocuria tytonicola TaxID=2055946 RepID=UPI000EF93C1D|nr:hypothetical protein [Kocuria tytonicola]RLZ03797.1 hypothetical protein CWC38_03810 [Kocuria tytonicola]
MAERDSRFERLRLPSWRVLRVPMVLIVVFVVLTVTAWSTAANYLLVAREPESPVDTYLGYLEGGSARQVLAPLMVQNGVDRAQLLGNAVYRAAANRPQHHEFVGTRVTGDVARVAVDVRTGSGATVRREYTVHRVSAWGPFNDSWQLRDRDDAPVAVHLPAAVDALTVNGATVRPDPSFLTPTDPSDPAAPARTWRLEGLPGAYDVALPRDSYLLASEHAPAVISMAAPREALAEVAYTASPRMWEAVERDVQDALARCRRAVHLDPGRCPVPRELARAASSAGSRGADGRTPAEGLPEGVSDVRWELASRPSLLLEQDAQDPLTFHAVRFRAAKASVEWVQDGHRKKGTVEFGIEATARTTGQRLETDVHLRSTLGPRERSSRPS